MNLFDVHIHMGLYPGDAAFDPEALLAKMEAAGVQRGAIFSEAPEFYGFQNRGHDGSQRLDLVLQCCEQHRERLLPILWVHPDEEGIVDLIAEAAGRNIAGFKVICNNFYVYEDKSMNMLERIAKTGKPVLFHSGILWDDSVSSKYNRPLHWEALCKMGGLRFSLAHCSWPWYDESIALYGKFLTNHMKHPDDNSEMFFDLTPGTPVPYRRDLLTKLLGCGYDVEHNILWGTDCNTDPYNTSWAQKWHRLDSGIMDELRVPEETRALIFEKNAERFFGLVKDTYKHRDVRSDGS